MDLTQYIEEHLFSFDQVFDEYVSNEQVSFPITSVSLKANDKN